MAKDAPTLLDKGLVTLSPQYTIKKSASVFDRSLWLISLNKMHVIAYMLCL